MRVEGGGDPATERGGWQGSETGGRLRPGGAPTPQGSTRARGERRGRPRGRGAGERREGGACWWGVHHQHDEGGGGVLGVAGRRLEAKGLRLRLEALRPCAHRAALQRVEHLLQPRPLRAVLADTVHQILPGRHEPEQTQQTHTPVSRQTPKPLLKGCPTHLGWGRSPTNAGRDATAPASTARGARRSLASFGRWVADVRPCGRSAVGWPRPKARRDASLHAYLARS